jgi:hypothetical protein
MSESVDFYNLIAAERGMPEGWRWHTLEAVGRHTLVTGAVCSVLFKRGPRKGCENWAKRDLTTEQQFVITGEELAARRSQWERDTGKCVQCFGSKEEIASVRVSGVTTRPCGRCHATGVAP